MPIVFNIKLCLQEAILDDGATAVLRLIKILNSFL